MRPAWPLSLLMLLLAAGVLVQSVLGQQAQPAPASVTPSPAPASAPTPAQAAAAQEAPAAAPAQSAGDRAPLSDPTQADEQLRRMLQGGAGAHSKRAEVSLRGLVVSAAGSASAVVQVDDTLFHVRRGSDIPLDAAGLQRMRVTVIDVDGVQLEDPTTGQRLRLN